MQLTDMPLGLFLFVCFEGSLVVWVFLLAFIHGALPLYSTKFLSCVFKAVDVFEQYYNWDLILLKFIFCN